MTEQTPAANAGQKAQEEPKNLFQIQRIYVKDISFESPAVPEVFNEQWQPKISLNLNNRSKALENNRFEVGLKLAVTATKDDKTIYLCEVEQAGVFLIQGMEKAKLAYTLGVACPSVLFPYARELIDSLAQRGTFPPLMLAPVNFDQVYREALKQQAEKLQKSAEANPGEVAGTLN